MARLSPLFVVALLVTPHQALRAEEYDLTTLKCSVRFPDGLVKTYKHAHHVPYVGVDPPGEPVNDTLEVVGRAEDQMCFGLSTVARNLHYCFFMGVATRTSKGAYVFKERNTELKFTVLRGGRIHIEPIGDGYRENCGMFGVVESAEYR
jgi:hypothetical protein